ncbi:MAG TPA: sulfate ABC transporter permease subunit CysW, partial [Pseudomonas sp.]|nr:sulfate ABC transporter permease subunit CysW [Pseudomonas sp.]
MTTASLPVSANARATTTRRGKQTARRLLIGAAW